MNRTRGILSILALVGGLAAAASLAGAANAAIIGANDWIPLSEAAKAYGFSERTVDAVLDGSGEMTCLGANAAGQTVVKARWVGWVWSVTPPVILTVGHSMFNSDDSTELRSA